MGTHGCCGRRTGMARGAGGIGDTTSAGDSSLVLGGIGDIMTSGDTLGRWDAMPTGDRRLRVLGGSGTSGHLGTPWGAGIPCQLGTPQRCWGDRGHLRDAGGSGDTIPTGDTGGWHLGFGTPCHLGHLGVLGATVHPGTPTGAGDSVPSWSPQGAGCPTLGALTLPPRSLQPSVPTWSCARESRGVPRP